MTVPAEYLTNEFYRSHNPAEAWKQLRAEPFTRGLDDAQVWDLVAHVWGSNTTAQALETGKKLFAQNCAACHGETGAGDGVMAGSLTGQAGAGDTLNSAQSLARMASDLQSVVGSFKV